MPKTTKKYAKVHCFYRLRHFRVPKNIIYKKLLQYLFISFRMVLLLKKWRVETTNKKPTKNGSLTTEYESRTI